MVHPLGAHEKYPTLNTDDDDFRNVVILKVGRNSTSASREEDLRACLRLCPVCVCEKREKGKNFIKLKQVNLTIPSTALGPVVRHWHLY